VTRTRDERPTGAAMLRGAMAAESPRKIGPPERIETRRLVLRPYAPTDGPALFEAVQESLSELRLWLPWADKHPDPEASIETCRRVRRGWDEQTDFTMGIFGREDGRLLGGTGLHRMKWDIPSFEIGYWVRSSASGRGFVTESTAGLARTCFRLLGAGRVEVFCDPRNAASRRVAERAGFAYEGTLRSRHVNADGSLRDSAVYSLVRQDWDANGDRIARIAEEGPEPTR
jgi:RimJ/RimL family protein N-acetyltransferase